MLHSKPTTIAMSNVCGSRAASTYHRSYYSASSWLHPHTPNQTFTLFYLCLAD